MRGELHVANVAHLGTLLASTGIDAGSIAIVEDNLAHGPLTPFASLEEWNARRVGYWKGVTLREGASVVSLAVARTFPPTLARDLAAADKVVYWLGPSLSEHVALAWLREVVAQVAPRCPFDVMAIQHHPVSGAPISSIMALSTEHFAAYRRTATPVTDAGDVLLQRAWAAVTQSDPLALEAFAAESGSHDFGTRAAFAAFADFFPLVGPGIDTPSLRMLEMLEDGPRTIGSLVASYMGEFGDDKSFTGDLLLRCRLQDLLAPAARVPLLEDHGGSGGAMKIGLAAPGRDVVAGAASNVALNGIERWIGGTWLDSTKPAVWHCDRVQRRFVSIPAH